MQKHTFKVQKHTFNLQNVFFKVQKYTLKVQKCSFKVQRNVWNLGNGISGTRNLNMSGSQNQFRPKPREQNLSCRNPSNSETFETSGTQPSSGPEPGFPELVPGNWTRNLGTTKYLSEPIETRTRPERPQLAQNTPKSILCKDPTAFCCWGINKMSVGGILNSKEVPFYTNALPLRTALPAALCQPQVARTWSHMSSVALGPGTFGTPSKPETFETVRTHHNPSKPGTPKPSKPQPLSEPQNPSKPGTSKTFKTTTPGECNLWNLEPSQDLTHGKPEPVPRIDFGAPEPVGTHRQPPPLRTHWNLEPVPGTRFLPGTAPARPEHTEIYIVQRPHSILLLGKNHWNHHPVHYTGTLLFWNLLKDSLHSSHRFKKGNFCHIPTPQLVNLSTKNSVGYYDVLGAFRSWWSIVPKVDLALHQIRHISRRSEIGWTSAAGRTWWRRMSSSFDFGYKHLQFTRNSFEDHNSNINISTLYTSLYSIYIYIYIHWWCMFIVTWWPNIFHNGYYLFSKGMSTHTWMQTHTMLL